MFTQRGHELARRDRARRDRTPATPTVLLECGHETDDAPIVRFPDGRERYACEECDGRIQRPKGAR